MDLISTLWKIDNVQAAEIFVETAAQKPRHVQNFINNEFVEPTDAGWLDSHDPKSGRVIFQLPRSSQPDVDRAIEAAAAAFSSWSKTTRQYRSAVLQRISTILQEKRETFALWESIDQGKTLERARIEVDRAIANFQYVYLQTYIKRIRQCGRMELGN